MLKRGMGRSPVYIPRSARQSSHIPTGARGSALFASKLFFGYLRFFFLCFHKAEAWEDLCANQ